MLATTLRRHAYFSLKQAGFLLPFLAATLPFQAWQLARDGVPADLAAWFPVFVVFGVIPLLDLLIGGDPVNPTDDESAALAKNGFYRALALGAVPLQLASVAFGAWAFTHWDLGPAGMIGWIAAVGTVSGSIGINVGHELIHKYSRLDQLAGGVLLSSSLYPGFKIEHVRGHHVDIGTPKDNTTARFGQTIYAYLALAFATNFRKAWRFERERLAVLGLPALHWRNELVWWYALCALFALALGIAFGWAAVGFFVAQAVFGIALLEVVNYIEHYGLERKQFPDGRYEPVSFMHSWNSDALLTNLFLFHLQRHADHHRYARRPYQILRSIPEAPQLPTGYAGMILVALVPPLWFRVMNPRAAQLRNSNRENR
jgi:alkane 1-monooxygenase